MTYYLKYRPQNLDELDQEGVRESLEKIVKSGNIPHALLFSGPKGTGKTSAARILAKIVNCEDPKDPKPCNKCEQCLSISKGQNLDVIELDAASHRGIEDVRQIRDAVKLSPVKARKKVYIIDEAHMLTTEASNALLKTLEEPPDHVMFILATTNPEKLIETIRSRVTNIVFKKATKSEIVRSLGKTAKGESVKVGDGVFDVIADSSGGSFRDAIKIFEQLVSENVELKKEKVEEILSTRKSFDVIAFLKYLEDKDTKNAVVAINSAIEKGAQAKDIAAVVIEYLREILLSSFGLGEAKTGDFKIDELITLTNLFSEAYSKIQYSFLEQVPLEIAVIEWCESKNSGSRMGTILNKADKKDGEEKSEEEKIPKPEVRTDDEKVGDRATPEEDGGIDSVNAGVTHIPQDLIADGMSEEVWNRVLGMIKPGHASTEALLRAAKPLEFNGQTLKLGVYYKFHKEHLEEVHHRDVLEKALESYLGSSVRVTCILTEPPPNKIKTSSNGDGNFGAHENGGVVLTEPDSTSIGVKPSLTSNNGEDIISIAEKIFGN